MQIISILIILLVITSIVFFILYNKRRKTANSNFVFVSTHDLELAELLGTDYVVYSFEETVADKHLVFDYRLKQGLLKSKNGIAVLQSVGFPDSVIADAYRVSEELRRKYQI